MFCLGLCEVSQQQNETQSVGTSMSHPLPLPSVAEHQSGPGPGPMGNYGSVEPSMTTVAASLGVPNNTVVSMATMTQPINQLVSPGQSNRPAFSPSYRGRPRGRRPSGSSSSSNRGGWAGGVGEKRSAQAAGLNANTRRPYRGAYRGTWPNRSPSKTSPTGSIQSTVQGSNSQGKLSTCSAHIILPVNPIPSWNYHCHLFENSILLFPYYYCYIPVATTHYVRNYLYHYYELLLLFSACFIFDFVFTVFNIHFCC